MNRGIMYFNVDLTSNCSSSVDLSGVATGAANSTSGTWSSGLEPPYILEQFAIEVLKDVAKKEGASASDAVTEEHVVALVAFMWGEGGDIMNHDLFNPLNTGINAPDLLASGNNASGLQSFKSFDAGVEATARTMVGGNQSRLASVLIQQGTTAQDFMSALTYYTKYPGNKFWAGASVPTPSQPNKADDYYKSRLGLVQQVRAHYADEAGTVLGTPAKEQLLNITAKEKLTYHPAGDKSSGTDTVTASTSSDSSCTNSGNSGNSGNTTQAIASKAVELSWPGPHTPKLEAKSEYTAALTQYNQAGLSAALSHGADCGVFVATVMRASGADPSYPQSGTSVQLAYVRAHPEKYTVYDKVDDSGGFQIGDVLIVGGLGNGTPGHTFIYVGPQPGGYDAASASMATRMPMLGKAITSDNRGNYAVARLK